MLSAVLGATVALSTRGTLDAARREQVVDRIALLDGRLRDRAVRSKTGQELVVDLDAKTLCAREVGAAAESTSSDTFVCPSLGTVVMGRERWESGRAVVSYAPSGRSSRFAIRLKGKKLADEWLTFAPMTGQLVRTAQEPSLGQAD